MVWSWYGPVCMLLILLMFFLHSTFWILALSLLYRGTGGCPCPDSILRCAMFKLYVSIFGGRIVYFDTYYALDKMACIMEELNIYCYVVEGWHHEKNSIHSHHCRCLRLVRRPCCRYCSSVSITATGDGFRSVPKIGGLIMFITLDVWCKGDRYIMELVESYGIGNVKFYDSCGCLIAMNVTLW